MRDSAALRTAEPRQQRAIETKAGLLAAVERIVAEEGSDAVTTTRIAADTGVAVGTIYRYFSDREAMLLEAYDANVSRLLETCGKALDAIPDDAPIMDVAMRLLDIYLDAAVASPAHAGLLAAMRRLRPPEMAAGQAQDRSINDIVAPFFARFGHTPASRDPLKLLVVNTVISTLVDIYLMTPDPQARAALRVELDAHAQFMISRML